MKINKFNYEEYLVSSLEGMLTTEEQALFDAFLHTHPELKKEVDAYKRAFLVPDETIIYPDKTLLYKHDTQRSTVIPSYKEQVPQINILNYEEFMVSSMEGKLTTEEQAALDNFLHEHPDLKHEMDAYNLVFLKPDRTIKYPGKLLLLKPETPVVPFYRRYSVWLSVAATILLLIAFRTFLFIDVITGNNNEPESQIQTANKGYAFSGRFDLPGRQDQENFIPNTGRPNANVVATNQTNKVRVVNHTDTGSVKQYNTISTKMAYIPQTSSKPHMTPLPANNGVVFVAQKEQAQHNQNNLINNAAIVGKTLWHLSGRQLPGEEQSGQQFHVVQVGYDSKDFSFVKIIH